MSTVRDYLFDDLPPRTAYESWWLRQRVFIGEQACRYEDMDGRDMEPGTRHVVLEEDGRVVGYCRVLDGGDTWRIGRVVLDPSVRGRGAANPLMAHAVSLCDGRDILLAAQSPLAPWYSSFGFAIDGDEFLEDDIPHLPMRRPQLQA